MKTIQRSIAALELLLIFPGVLFMTALFARNVQPPKYEPAHTAQRIVDWYAAQPHIGLWLLLIALPLAVLVTGSLALARNWRSHLAAFLVAAATLTAACILAIVALHVLTD